MTTFGAICWGILNDEGQFGGWTRQRLGPAQFAPKRPWFVTGANNALVGRSDTQPVCDAQINKAYYGGLDYFVYNFNAFAQDFYAPGSGGFVIGKGENSSLTYHRSSSCKGLIKICINILALSYNVPNATEWGICKAYYVALFQDSDYMTVTISGVVRPLVYFYNAADQIASHGWVTAAALKTKLDDLRAACITAGLNTPYIVGLSDTTNVANLGLDAVGWYNVYPAAGTFPTAGSPQTPETFSAYAGRVDTQRAALAAGFAKIVPEVAFGVDYRMTAGGIAGSDWPAGTDQAAAFPPYVTAPTTAEIATVVQTAKTYVAANLTKCESDTVIMYAFSEHAECAANLEPTWGDKGMNLQIGVAQALGKQRCDPKIYRANGITQANW